MELTRGAVARLLNPFLKQSIRDITKWWPMPFDEKKEQAIEEMTEEEKKQSYDELCRLADKIFGNGQGIQSEGDILG